MGPVFVTWGIFCQLLRGFESSKIAVFRLGMGLVASFALIVPSGEHLVTSLRACCYKHSTLVEGFKTKVRHLTKKILFADY